MRNEVIGHLRAGRLAEAAVVLLAMSETEIPDLLYHLADDQPDSLGIAVYGLAVYFIQEFNDPPFWHQVAVGVLVNSICWVPGAYALGLYHARKGIELRPDDARALEMALFFYDVPDRPMDGVEAQQYAKELLRLEPDNEIAKRVLAK